MEDNSPQGKKIPLIVIGVAMAVIAVGIAVRSGRSPEPAPAPEPAPELAPEPAPLVLEEPEASPQITYSSLASTDDEGDRWTLGLIGVPPQAPQGVTEAGAPLSVKADVQGYGQVVSIGLIIEGRAGEVYEPGALKNGRRTAAPKFTVFDEAGKEIGSGSFEYG